MRNWGLSRIWQPSTENDARAKNSAAESTADSAARDDSDGETFEDAESSPLGTFAAPSSLPPFAPADRRLAGADHAEHGQISVSAVSAPIFRGPEPTHVPRAAHATSPPDDTSPGEPLFETSAAAEATNDNLKIASTDTAVTALKTLWEKKAAGASSNDEESCRVGTKNEAQDVCKLWASNALASTGHDEALGISPAASSDSYSSGGEAAESIESPTPCGPKQAFGHALLGGRVAATEPEFTAPARSFVISPQGAQSKESAHARIVEAAIQAAIGGTMQPLHQLREQGIDLVAWQKDHSENSLAHRAASNDCEESIGVEIVRILGEIARPLLECHVTDDVNFLTTPARCAAYWGKTELLKVLLEFGVNMTEDKERGWNLSRNKEQTAKTLKEFNLLNEDDLKQYDKFTVDSCDSSSCKRQKVGWGSFPAGDVRAQSADNLSKDADGDTRAPEDTACEKLNSEFDGSRVSLVVKILAISGLPGDSRQPFTIRAAVDDVEKMSKPSLPAKLSADDIVQIILRLHGQTSIEHISRIVGLRTEKVQSLVDIENESNIHRIAATVHEWDHLEFTELVQLIIRMQTTGMSCEQIRLAVVLPLQLVEAIVGGTLLDAAQAIAQEWAVTHPRFDDHITFTLPWTRKTMDLTLEILDSAACRIGDIVSVSLDSVLPGLSTEIEGPFHASGDIALCGSICACSNEDPLARVLSPKKDPVVTNQSRDTCVDDLTSVTDSDIETLDKDTHEALKASGPPSPTTASTTWVPRVSESPVVSVEFDGSAEPSSRPYSSSHAAQDRNDRAKEAGVQRWGFQVDNGNTTETIYEDSDEEGTDKKDSDTEAMDDDIITEAVQAAMRGNTQLLRRLKESGIDLLAWQTDHGSTSLAHMAASDCCDESNGVEMIRALGEIGKPLLEFNVAKKKNILTTPARSAVYWGRTEILKTLRKFDVDMTEDKERGWQLLHNREQTAQLLKDFDLLNDDDLKEYEEQLKLNPSNIHFTSYKQAVSNDASRQTAPASLVLDGIPEGGTIAASDVVPRGSVNSTADLSGIDQIDALCRADCFLPSDGEGKIKHGVGTADIEVHENADGVRQEEARIGDEATKAETQNGRAANKDEQENPSLAGPPPSQEPFIASTHWTGAKLGYTFTRGEKGIGDYIDHKDRNGEGHQSLQDNTFKRVEDDRFKRSLHVSILSAKGLRNADLISKSDPYCALVIGGKEVMRTHTIQDTLEPTWNYQGVVEDYLGEDIEFSVWDDDGSLKSDDFLGKALLSSDKLQPGQSCKLELCLNDAGKEASATLRVLVCVVEKEIDSCSAHPRQSDTLLSDVRDDDAEACNLACEPALHGSKTVDDLDTVTRVRAVSSDKEDAVVEDDLQAFSACSDDEDSSCCSPRDKVVNNNLQPGSMASPLGFDPPEFVRVAKTNLETESCMGWKTAKAAFLGARQIPIPDLSDPDVQEGILCGNEYTEVVKHLFLAGDYIPQKVAYLNGIIENMIPKFGLVVRCSEKPSECREAIGIPLFAFEPKEDSEGRMCVGVHCFDLDAKGDLLTLKDGCIQIKAKLEQQCNVLVHCQQGVDRSATVVAAFCMAYFDISAADARESLKRLRPACTEQVPGYEDLLRTHESKIRRFFDSFQNPAVMFREHHARTAIMQAEVRTLRISIFSAKGLRNADWMSKSDPYCIVMIEGKEIMRTHVINDSLEPVWKFDGSFDGYMGENIEFHVWDDDGGGRKSDDFLGKAVLVGDEIHTGEISCAATAANALWRELPLSEAGRGVNASLSIAAFTCTPDSGSETHSPALRRSDAAEFGPGSSETHSPVLCRSDTAEFGLGSNEIHSPDLRRSDTVEVGRSEAEPAKIAAGATADSLTTRLTVKPPSSVEPHDPNELKLDDMDADEEHARESIHASSKRTTEGLDEIQNKDEQRDAPSCQKAALQESENVMRRGVSASSLASSGSHPEIAPECDDEDNVDKEGAGQHCYPEKSAVETNIVAEKHHVHPDVQEIERSPAPAQLVRDGCNQSLRFAASDARSPGDLDCIGAPDEPPLPLRRSRPECPEIAAPISPTGSTSPEPQVTLRRHEELKEGSQADADSVPTARENSSIMLTMKILRIVGLPDDSKAPFVVRAVVDGGLENMSTPSRPDRLNASNIQQIILRLRDQNTSIEQISQAIGLQPETISAVVNATDEEDFRRIVAKVKGWDRIEFSELAQIIYRLQEHNMSCAQIAQAVALPHKLVEAIINEKDSLDSAQLIADHWSVTHPRLEQWEAKHPWTGNASMDLKLELLDAAFSQIGKAAHVRIENVYDKIGMEIEGPFQVSADIALHGCVCMMARHHQKEKQSTCDDHALVLAVQARDQYVMEELPEEPTEKEPRAHKPSATEKLVENNDARGPNDSDAKMKCAPPASKSRSIGSDSQSSSSSGSSDSDDSEDTTHVKTNLQKAQPEPGPRSGADDAAKEPHLTVNDEQALRNLFDRCDTSGDQSLNKRELIKICRADKEVAEFLGMPSAIRQEDGSRESFERFFQSIDENDARELSWEEFKKWFRRQKLDEQTDSQEGSTATDAAPSIALTAGGSDSKTWKCFSCFRSGPSRADMVSARQSLDAALAANDIGALEYALKEVEESGLMSNKSMLDAGRIDEAQRKLKAKKEQKRAEIQRQIDTAKAKRDSGALKKIVATDRMYLNEGQLEDAREAIEKIELEQTRSKLFSRNGFGSPASLK